MIYIQQNLHFTGVCSQYNLTSEFPNLTNLTNLVPYLTNLTNLTNLTLFQCCMESMKGLANPGY